MKFKFLNNKENIEQWGPIDMKLLYPSFWFGPMSGAVKSPWGVYWTEMVGVIKNNQGTLYWHNGSLENEGIRSIKKWLIPPAKRKQVTAAYWNILKRLARVTKEITKETNFYKIRELTLKWYKLYEEFWGITDVFEIGNFGAPVLLKKELQNIIPPQDLNHVMEILLAPEKISFNQISQKELLECRLRTTSKTRLLTLLEKYASKWYWLNNSYYGSTRLDAKYFYGKIKNMTGTQAKHELSEIRTYASKIKRSKTAAAKKFHIPKKIAALASLLSFSIWIQDHRKGKAWEMSEIITILSRHLAKHLNVPPEDVLNYSSEEWKQSFVTGKKLSPKIISARKKGFVMYSYTGFYKYIVGQKAQKISESFKNLSSHTLTSDRKTLSGIVVSKSTKAVKGKVRVLHSAHEISQMKQGEILVTAMTSPDYIHAMRKAKAIITDIGGLMSHAAVVSRELGIPCIVNTKLATKILKTGDMVEVNTNTGIIKKLL